MSVFIGLVKDSRRDGTGECRHERGPIDDRPSAAALLPMAVIVVAVLVLALLVSGVLWKSTAGAIVVQRLSITQTSASGGQITRAPPLYVTTRAPPLYVTAITETAPDGQSHDRAAGAIQR